MTVLVPMIILIQKLVLDQNTAQAPLKLQSQQRDQQILQGC